MSSSKGFNQQSFVLRYNPEYRPIEGPVFKTDKDGNIRNLLLPLLPANQPFFAFPEQASNYLKMTWKDTWAFIKRAEMCGALVNRGRDSKLVIVREALETLRGERLPQPDLVRSFWFRTEAMLCK